VVSFGAPRRTWSDIRGARGRCSGLLGSRERCSVCWVPKRERERWQRESVGQWVPVGGEGEIWEMGGNFGNECEMTATRVLNLLKKKKNATWVNRRMRDGGRAHV